ncbi:hypothetical protein [Rhizobiales bacterium]|uniref:hypothetical protein n=1 Tax=Rhizobium sp. 11_C7_N12_5 TaxID=3240770 RepID=UPI000DDE2D59
MGTQPASWWNGQSEMTRRLGSGLAVCGTVVGALYLIVQTAPADRAMRFVDDSGVIAISSAKPLEHVAMSGPQVVVDASPARQTMSVPIPSPSPLASTEKAAVTPKRVASHAGIAKTKVASSGGVERFDRCLPQCETRDPLIAGEPEYAQAEQPLVNDERPPVVEERVGFRPLAGARYLLSQAADAPGAVLRQGRRAIDDVASIGW